MVGLLVGLRSVAGRFVGLLVLVGWLVGLGAALIKNYASLKK